MVAVHWFKGSDVLKSVNGYQHIVWWLLVCFATAVSEWIGMLKNCRTGVTDELFVHIIEGHMNKSTLWYTKNRGQLAGEWQTCKRLVLVLPLKSSTTKFTSMEFVEVGFPNNFWTHIIVIDCSCTIVMRELCLSEFHCCFWWNMDALLWSSKQLSKYRLEILIVPC
jgi:hypothetical protein